MITSRDNDKLKLVRKLQERRGRDKHGLFVCEGEDLVVAALDAGLEAVEALVDAERPVLLDRLPRADHVASELLAAVSALGHPPRVLAVFRSAGLPRLDPAHSPPLGLALWQVGDPGNVGTLLRALDAFGPGFVALSPGCADPTGPKALRAAAGATFRVPSCGFHEAPGRRVALVVRGGVPLAELEPLIPTTIVLGPERERLPDEVLARCDAVATIPQTGPAESLNVAMAGTVALYELGRRTIQTESSSPSS
jgi:TrmH family RNA methyltransferase